MFVHGNQRLVLGLAAIGAMVAGCRDQVVPTHPRVPGDAPARAVVTTVNSDWDGFSADVTVQTTRLDANGKTIIGQHPLQYHLERHFSGATWNLVLTFASRARAAVAQPVGKFDPERFEVARFEDDGNGTPPRVYDGLGRQISMQAPPALPPGIDQSSAGVAAVRAALARNRLLGMAAAAHPASTDRRWVEFFVLSPENRAARAAALAQQYGASRRNAGGMDEYVARHDSVTLTVTADPSTAGVLSVVEETGGRVARRWTTRYDTGANGTATKAETRVESVATDGSKGTRVAVTQFANVRFEKGK